MADKAACAAVYKYLYDRNRPYSLTDIHMNLHKEYGKTLLQRCLDVLVQEQKVVEKAYGKQKVYVVSQDAFPAVDEQQIKSMDARLVALKNESASLEAQLKDVESKLKAVNSTMTSTEAQAALVKCNAELKEKTERLASLKEASGNFDAEELRKYRDSGDKLLKEWRKRKRVATDILDAILEGYPKSKKELYEEAGIETDQDVGVTMPA